MASAVAYMNASKPATDSKQYGYFDTDVGLKVVLVHEDTGSQKKAVAALGVGGLAGSFSDPHDRQGLAHFCEHAMFMGSAQYPKENEYDDFLSRHGGSSNAFTDNEQTVYQFEVGCTPQGVDGALSRLSAFFIAPLFSEGSVEREVRAVDTEYRRAARDDGSRTSQMQAHSSVRGHPYASFGWGNGPSLWGEKRGVEGVPGPEGAAKHDVSALISDLKAFHSRAYLARHMVLALRADGSALKGALRATATQQGGSADINCSGGSGSALSDAEIDAMSGVQVLEALVRRHFAAVPAAPGTGQSKAPAGPSTVASASAGNQAADAMATGVVSIEHTLATLEAHHRGLPIDQGQLATTGVARPFGSPASPIPSSRPVGDVSSCDPRVHFIASVGSRHTINITWALPPLHPSFLATGMARAGTATAGAAATAGSKDGVPSSAPWQRCGPEHLLSYIIGHEAEGTLLPALRSAGWALELMAGIGSNGGTDSSSLCSLFGITIHATPAGMCAWREVVAAVQSYVVHVLCGGINVAELLGRDPETAVLSGPGLLHASNAAAKDGQAAGPFDESRSYALLSGHTLPGSTLSALSTRMDQLSWAWAETSADSLVNYNFGDAPDPWDHVTEMVSVLGRGMASPAEALLTASGVFGPVPAGIPVSPSGAATAAGSSTGAGSSATSTAGSARPDPARFSPHMTAYLAAHLHPGNCRVDIVSPLCGKPKGQGGPEGDDDEEEEDGTEGEGDEEGDEDYTDADEDMDDAEGEDDDDSDEDEDVDQNHHGHHILPDPRLHLAVTVEHSTGPGADGKGTTSSAADDNERGAVDEEDAGEDHGAGQPDDEDHDSNVDHDDEDQDDDEEDEEAEVASLLTPAEATFLVKTVEPYFFSEYAWTPVDPSTVSLWVRPPPVGAVTGNKSTVRAANKALKQCSQPLRDVLSQLKLPPRNPYTPTDLSVKLGPTVISDVREVGRRVYALGPRGRLYETPMSTSGEGVTNAAVITRLWYGPNGTFKSPRCEVRCMVYTPAQYDSAPACAAADVWASLVSESVNNDVYLASIAGLDGSIENMPRHGLKIAVGGIGQHAGALLGKLVAAATCTDDEKPRSVAKADIVDARGKPVAGQDEAPDAVEDADMPSIRVPSKRPRGAGGARQVHGHSGSNGAAAAAAAGGPAQGTAASSGHAVVEPSRLSRWTDAVLREYSDALLAPSSQAHALWFKHHVEVATPGGHAGSIASKAEALQALVAAGQTSVSVGKDKSRVGLVKTAPHGCWAEQMQDFLSLRSAPAEPTGNKGEASKAEKDQKSSPSPPGLWSFEPGSKPIIVDVVVVGNETLETATDYMETAMVAVLRAAGRWVSALPWQERGRLEEVVYSFGKGGSGSGTSTGMSTAAAGSDDKGKANAIQAPPSADGPSAALPFVDVPTPSRYEAPGDRYLKPVANLPGLYPPALVRLYGPPVLDSSSTGGVTSNTASTAASTIIPADAPPVSPEAVAMRATGWPGTVCRVAESSVSPTEVNSVVQVMAWAGPDTRPDETISGAAAHQAWASLLASGTAAGLPARLEAWPATRRRALISFLVHLASEPFFDSLRTRQQLGYEVWCGHISTGDAGAGRGAGGVAGGTAGAAMGLQFVVESASHAPEDVERRIFDFLPEWRAGLGRTIPDDATLMTRLKSWAAIHTQPLESLGEVVEDVWTQVRAGSCDFYDHRRGLMAACLLGQPFVDSTGHAGAASTTKGSSRAGPSQGAGSAQGSTAGDSITWPRLTQTELLMFIDLMFKLKGGSSPVGTTGAGSATLTAPGQTVATGTSGNGKGTNAGTGTAGTADLEPVFTVVHVRAAAGKHAH